MKLPSIKTTFVAAAISLTVSITGIAQDAKEAAPEAPKAAATEKKKPTQEELEAKFIATMTKATMSGRWCLIHEGKLTPEKEDNYTIEGVLRNPNGWIIKSRVQYNKVDMVVPVPVKIEWASDTPVIIVDDLLVPGGNTYSARVMIYEDSYAGTWSGPGVQGLLNGMITREEEKKEESAPKEK
ncbi:MAG: hypothetical protein ACI9DF_002811 [Verrucomicrobiales bacterium]|jgi:hypothetical protein